MHVHNLRNNLAAVFAQSRVFLSLHYFASLLTNQFLNSFRIALLSAYRLLRMSVLMKSEQGLLVQDSFHFKARSIVVFLFHNWPKYLKLILVFLIAKYLLPTSLASLLQVKLTEQRVTHSTQCQTEAQVPNQFAHCTKYFKESKAQQA